MGGVNHQPCGKYLIESTELSRAMSSARSKLELANIAVEDVLLRELRGAEFDRGLAEAVVANLEASKADLESMALWLERISDKLEEVDGWEPPTVTTINWVEVGDALVAAGAVDEAAWRTMTSTRAAAGFPGIIAVYQAKLRSLANATTELQSEITCLAAVMEGRAFAQAVEENRAGEFKILFARLYREWAEFQQMFLASALLSTESWYRWSNCGSLVEATAASKAA